MGEYTNYNWKEIDRFLVHIGCEFKRQKGSHRIYKKDGVVKLIAIPEHKTISIGVVMQTLRNLGVEKDEFLKIIKEL